MIEFNIIHQLPADMPPCPRCHNRETGLVSRKLTVGDDVSWRWLVMCLNPACTFLAEETRCKAAALLAWYIAALRGRR